MNKDYNQYKEVVQDVSIALKEKELLRQANLQISVRWMMDGFSCFLTKQKTDFKGLIRWALASDSETD